MCIRDRLWALLLQAFYSIRSERQLMERLEYDLLFRWFVGLGVVAVYAYETPRLHHATAAKPSWSARTWAGVR